MSEITPEDLKSAAQDLPPSPQVFGKLGKLLRDPGTDLSDIADLVNTDSSLTARVLRLSNSAAFAQDLAIDNLDDAINRVGFREVFRLVGLAAASDLFATRNQTYGIEGSTLWENSLSCGLVMEDLARKTGHDEQEFYTLGLLRSMGKLVIDVCATSKSMDQRYESESGEPILAWEEKVFGITNPSVADFLLSTWNFPEETVNSIQLQYLDKDAESAPQSALLLNVAGALAERVNLALPGESAYWDSLESRCGSLGLNESDLDDTVESVKERLEEVLASVAG